MGGNWEKKNRFTKTLGKKFLHKNKHQAAEVAECLQLDAWLKTLKDGRVLCSTLHNIHVVYLYSAWLIFQNEV